MSLDDGEDAAHALLDLNCKLFVGRLDRVIETLYSASAPSDRQRTAQEELTRLKDHPEAWTKVNAILELSNNPQTKYFALQILEGFVKTRWRILPRLQCEGIKNNIVRLIIKTSSDPEALEKEKTYLNKLNMILVQILKREWPKHWLSFLPDMIRVSKTNDSLYQNTMVILKLLSEEVFNFSSGQMTQRKIKKYLKATLCSQSSEVFQLCQYVLNCSHNDPLVGATLETLLKLLNWIPPDYIFESSLIDVLVVRFFNAPLFRNVTLKCLTEIASVSVTQYDDAFLNMYSQTMRTLEAMLPTETNIKEAYARRVMDDQQFIQDLALFFCSVLKQHGGLIEKRLNHEMTKSLLYMVLISEVDEVEIFKVCLEYWRSLAEELCQEKLFSGSGTSGSSVNRRGSGLERGPRREAYKPILNKVRYIMISRMAKPEEVLVVENDQGEVVREFMRNTDSIDLYKTMKETLVYLTHLDCVETKNIMTEKLSNQVNGSEWSWKNLNTLCWAIGSISGSMQEEDEEIFLIPVIKDLLGFCGQKEGKDNKAIIASNIMYIVGQYPRFLRAHWDFLKAVVDKLFEFMHESHEGVQDMACDTFLKIAKKCKRQLVKVHAGEVMPLIDEILANINSIICDLQPQQAQTFYEALGHMIASCKNSQRQDRLIDRYMQLPNNLWGDLMNEASKNIDILKDHEVVKQLCSILKTNVGACKGLGHCFVAQLSKIFPDMLNVYKVMSENILIATKLNGESVIRQPVIKTMRGVKKEILKILSCWVERSSDPQLVLDDFVPPLLDTLLMDYQRCSIPLVCEPEVLSLMTTMVNKLRYFMTPQIPKIFDALFACTYEMINKDFEELPEHRTNFFVLLQAVNKHCFTSLLSISPPQFKLVFDSIILALKHTMRNVADLGLNILYQLLQNMNSQPEAAQSFYKTHYIEIWQHMLGIVTDTSHTAGRNMQAIILAYMLALLEGDHITIYLGLIAEPNFIPLRTANIEFVQNNIRSLIKTLFPHLTDNQIHDTVQGLFNFYTDISMFKGLLRDFLVKVRELAGEDDSDLFLEELEIALMQAQDDKKRYQMTVPGMLNPHENLEEIVEEE